MAKYINKSALVAEIDNWIEFFTNKKNEEGISQIAKLSFVSRITELQGIKDFIDTLEVKEVNEEPASKDLEEAAHQYAWDKQEHHIDFDGDEYLDYGVRFDAFKTGAKWQKEQTVKGVDLEKELIIWHRLHFKKGGTFEKYGGFYLANSSQLDLAKHFFELGLKAQQKGG